MVQCSEDLRWDGVDFAADFAAVAAVAAAAVAAAAVAAAVFAAVVAAVVAAVPPEQGRVRLREVSDASGRCCSTRESNPGPNDCVEGEEAR